jgi:hypothetical protein
MKTAYIGHSYHQKTRSTSFFLAFLDSLGTVDAYWETGWGDRQDLDLDRVLGRNYDLIILFQAFPHAPALSRSSHPNIVFVPMYDGCKQVPDRFWDSCRNLKYLCFCASLHERFSRLNLRCAYFQYFPEPPRQAPIHDFNRLRGFFWPRTQQLTWQRHIRPLVAGTSFDQITLHLAPDPGNDVTKPSAEDIRQYNVVTTSWFADRDNYFDTLRRHNVYFAPRRTEGIGLSFLEAMAMGMAVVTPNSPTMNEYIVDRVNGYLYDPDRPKSIDFSSAQATGAKARETAELGYQQWIDSLPRLKNFVLAV